LAATGLGRTQRCLSVVSEQLPPHIARLVVELAAPRTTDIICDPASGHADLLTAAARFVREQAPGLGDDPELESYFRCRMFHGFVASDEALTDAHAALGLAGVDQPDIRLGDAWGETYADERKAYSLVLAALPAGGAADPGMVAKDLRRQVKTRRRELLALALSLVVLRPGGRAFLLVPESLLSGGTKAHHALRRVLVEERRLEAIIRLPAGVVPSATKSAAVILCLRESSDLDTVWFYDVMADGFSLDRKRTPLLSEDRLGTAPSVTLSADEHVCNNLPDLLARWPERGGKERDRSRSAQSFCVPRAQIAAAAFDLTLAHYRQPAEADAEQRRPHEILAQLAGLEAEILQGIRDLAGMLKAGG
jgi:type I restriction enzyme M protein